MVDGAEGGAEGPRPTPRVVIVLLLVGSGTASIVAGCSSVSPITSRESLSSTLALPR